MNKGTIPEEPKIPTNADATHNATALSLFDQAGGANDFPVLKAFQEYIEAEQARSRKRMLGLSIFFVVLLVVVVVTFSVIMAAVIDRDRQNLSAITARNQELSDKLLDIALRDRTAHQQPVVNVQPATPQIAPLTQPSQDSMIKPLLEKIESLASALAAKPQQPATQSAPVAATQQSVESPETLQLREELRRQKEAVEKIRAEREKLKVEEELKVERERLRQQQVELHRRRLYPEFYAREDAKKELDEAAKRLPPPPPPAMENIVPPKPKASPKPLADSKPKLTPKPVDLKTAKPISYFDEPEPPKESEQKTTQAPKKDKPQKDVAITVAPPQESQKPDAKKPDAQKSDAQKTDAQKTDAQKTDAKKTETLNVSGEEGKTVPFLIELPETK